MSKKKRWKKVLSVLLFVALNVAVILITAISEFGNSANAMELAKVKINFWLLLPAVGLFVLATIANIYKYVLMIRNANKAGEGAMTKRASWKLAWRVVMLGKYYDNITPSAVGGQPFQIYYMRKKSNLPRGQMTSIPIVGMIAGQIGFLVVAVLCFVFSDFLGKNPTLMVAAWLGLLIYAFWPIFIFGANFFPKTTARIVKWVVKVLAKLRIVKNREAALKKVEIEVREYMDAIKIILKTDWLFLKLILLAAIYTGLTMLIPFFVLQAFGGNIGLFESLVLTLAVTSAVYFVPTPGNSGAAEGTFFVVFSALSSGYVFWAMLIWRFFSYYVYILIGPLIYLRMHFEKKKLSRKN